MMKMTARYKLYLDNISIVMDATCFDLLTSDHQAAAKKYRREATIIREAVLIQMIQISILLLK
jgi:hypothetical protein